MCAYIHIYTHAHTHTHTHTAPCAQSPQWLYCLMICNWIIFNPYAWWHSNSQIWNLQQSWVCDKPQFSSTLNHLHGEAVNVSDTFLVSDYLSKGD
jgi:hypothetical protein